MSEGRGYSEDECFYCRGKDAAYQMVGPDKEMHDACEECAKKRIKEGK